MIKLKHIALLLILISCTKPEINLGEYVFLEEISSIKTFGGSKNEVAKSVISTTDGGYAILGYTQSTDGDITTKNEDSFDYYVLKFSSDDKLQWSKTYGGSNDDRGSQIIQTFDGGYAIFGYSKSSDRDVTSNAGDRDFWLVKLDASGTISWQKSYGYLGVDVGVTLLQTDDKGFLIAGELDVTSSGGQGNTKIANKHAGGDYWAIKTDENGNKQWSKYYGGNFTDTPRGIAKTADGGFIIAGRSDSSDVDISNNKGTYDFWVIRISATGTLIWEKSYGGSEIDEARGISSTDDGNFIIVGDTRSSDKDVSNNNGGADLWVIKINPEGTILWEKTFGGSSFDVARSIKKTADGGFIISGSSRSLDNGFTNQGQNDAWLLKISSEGNQEWQKIIGGSKIDFFHDAVELNNRTIIAVGESESNDGDIATNKGFSDLLIIKIR